MKKFVQIIIAEHPDLKRSRVVDVPYRRQLLSTLHKRFVPKGADLAIYHNDENVTDQDLRKIKTEPGDRIVFAPRIGFVDFFSAWSFFLTNAIATIAPHAFWAGVNYGISYLGGKLFGQDLPDSDAGYSGQSFGFAPITQQGEGGAVPQAFGTNQHHGTLLAKWTAVDPTGYTHEILYMLVGFGEGPTGGIVDGQIWLNDRPITDYSGVTWDERRGTLNQTAMTDFTKTKIEMRHDVDLSNAGGAVTITIPRSGFDDIEYTIEFPRGLFKYSKAGELGAYGAIIKLEIAEVGTEDWSTLYDNLTPYKAQLTPIYYARSVVSDDLFEVDRTKQYKLKFTKTSGDSGVRATNDLKIRSVRGVVDIAFTRPGKALLGIKAMGTSDLSGNIDVKCIRQDRIVATYNGAAWSWEYSHNRAWVDYSMLTQPVLTGDGDGTPYDVDSYEGFDPSQLDTAFFYEWSQLCDDQVTDGNGGTEDLMPCHHIFDTKGELWKSAYQVAEIGRAHLVWQGTKLTGWIDKEWSGNSDLITSENIIEGSWKQEWTKQKELAGNIIVNYQDAARGHKRIPWPISNTNAGRYQNIISVEAIGIKSRAGASRIGWFALKRNELIREADSFRMHKDALRYKVGDVHPIQHNKPNWGTAWRVRRYVNSNTIELDRTVVATAGDSLYIRAYNSSSGDVDVRSYTVAGISGAKIKITTTFTVQPVFDDIVAIGSTSQIKLRRITRIEWTPDHFFEIAVEQYDPDLYDTDAGSPVMPYPESAPPAVRNRLDVPVTRWEVQNMIEQAMRPGIDTDTPIMSNITWSDNTPGAGSISWSATTPDDDLEIRYRGTSYAITASNTSDQFVYWVPTATTFATTASAATMRTQLAAGAWLVRENKAGTALPSTPLGNVWAGLLQAGTITAALGIIGDLAVDTLQIADNAVNILSVVESATTDYLDPSPQGSAGFGLYRTPIWSELYESTGQPVLITFDGDIDGTYLTANTVHETAIFRGSGEATEKSISTLTLNGTDPVLVDLGATEHGLSTNDYVWLWGIVGTVELNDAICKILVNNAYKFYLVDTRSDWFTAYTSGGTMWKVDYYGLRYNTITAGGYGVSHIATTNLTLTPAEEYQYVAGVRNRHATQYSFIMSGNMISVVEIKK